MSDSFHFLVKGQPVSFRANREAVQRWRRKVAEAARKRAGGFPPDDKVCISITHFYHAPPRGDADNISKTICDALTNVVYDDDRQITECIYSRVPLYRPIWLRGMPKELAVTLCDNHECVFVRIVSAQRTPWAFTRVHFMCA